MNDSLVNQITLLFLNCKVSMGEGNVGEEWIRSLGLAGVGQYIQNG